ncbi:membrane protein FAM174B isoform X1 [Callorhinus ursinus]|uniref:membrane protein FAM174B isoform X1 n=1 Tax=Callorhinus ursinus TaxID=34884 RepID=UPI003CD0446C
MVVSSFLPWVRQKQFAVVKKLQETRKLLTSSSYKLTKEFLYAGDREISSGKRLKKTRKYDIITTPAERVEMAPLNEDDDDDEDSTVFDIKYRCGPALPLPSTGDSWARAVTQWDRPPGTWAPSKPWNWNPVCGGKAQCFRLSHQYRGHLPGAFCWAWQTRPAAKSDLLNPRASARGLLNKTLSA